MAQLEVYRVLPQGRRRLCAAIDGETDGIVAVRNATPVIMQAQGQRLHTAVAPTPKPKPTAQPKPAARICAQCESLQCHCGQTPTPPERITTQTAARKAVLQAMMADVPPPPSFDRVLERQRQLGLR